MPTWVTCCSVTLGKKLKAETWVRLPVSNDSFPICLCSFDPAGVVSWQQPLVCAIPVLAGVSVPGGVKHVLCVSLAGDLPHSLPGYLVFHCSNPTSWVYADQRCNGLNDCGDCSDEMGSCKSVCWLLPFLLMDCNSLYRCGACGCCWKCLEAGIHH